MSTQRKPTKANRSSLAESAPPPPGEVIDTIIDKNRPTPVRAAHRYDLDVLESLRKIVRAIDIYSHRLRVQYDITAPQLITLLTLVEGGPMSGTLLAQRTHLSPATSNGIVNRLEAKNLVKRTRDRKDRRVVRISVTPQGHRLIANAPSPMQDNLATGIKALPEREQATISSSLNRIVRLMEAHDIDAAPVLETGELNE
jgi:DNA-binding MarR family transcriptional regulator